MSTTNGSQDVKEIIKDFGLDNALSDSDFEAVITAAAGESFSSENESSLLSMSTSSLNQIPNNNIRIELKRLQTLLASKELEIVNLKKQFVLSQAEQVWEIVNLMKQEEEYEKMNIQDQRRKEILREEITNLVRRAHEEKKARQKLEIEIEAQTQQQGIDLDLAFQKHEIVLANRKYQQEKEYTEEYRKQCDHNEEQISLMERNFSNQLRRTRLTRDESVQQSKTALSHAKCLVSRAETNLQFLQKQHAKDVKSCASQTTLDVNMTQVIRPLPIDETPQFQQYRSPCPIHGPFSQPIHPSKLLQTSVAVQLPPFKPKASSHATDCPLWFQRMVE